LVDTAKHTVVNKQMEDSQMFINWEYLKTLEDSFGREKLVNILERFLTEAEENLQKINQFIQEDKTSELAQIAHSMKSVYGNVGLTLLTNLASELQNVAGGKLQGDLHELYYRLAKAQDHASTEIKHKYFAHQF
jgi:HPt (histidine-containing phosphotransfer) domain-containing protein